MPRIYHQNAATAITIDPDTSTGPTTGDPTDTGIDPACLGGDVSFDFNLDPEPDYYYDLELEYECVVGPLAPGGTDLTIPLECVLDDTPVEQSPTLHLTFQPGLPAIALEEGASVRLRYEQYAPFWTERALRIDTLAGDLVLAAVHTSGALDPFAGVTLDPLDPLCPASDDDFCGPVQHERVAITVDGAEAEVQSSEFATVGAFGAWARRLTHFVDTPQCTDTPNSWRSLALVRTQP